MAWDYFRALFPNQAAQLDRIEAAVQPQLSISAVSIEAIPRRKEIIVVGMGNHFWDKVLLRMTVTPNGALDAPPAWTSDNPAVTLAPAADGLSCDASANADVASFAVTATAPADNPSTPDLESVSETFTGSFSHSKADALVGGFAEVPR